MESSRHNASSINYIWVGPPNTSGVGIPGHDVAGPINMATVNNHNPVIFWCLFDYIDDYKEKFKSYPNIEVRSIDHHIASQSELPEFEKEADILIAILTKSLNEKKKRNSIRDRVTLKEAFSLFLLCTQSGYILDTNVLPLEDIKSITLPIYNTVKIVAFKEDPQENTDLDVWALYSPSLGREESRNMLNSFYLQWIKAEEYYRSHGPTAIYYDLISTALPLAVKNEFIKGNLGLWVVPGLKDNSIILKELGLIKHYSNTHKYKSRKKYTPHLFTKPSDKDRAISEIFFAAQAKNSLWLKTLIHYGIDVNERILKASPFHYEGETALHIAVNMNNTNNAKILLAAGANPDIPALYPGDIETTARDLMKTNKAFVKILEKLPSFNILPNEHGIARPKTSNRDEAIHFRKATESNWGQALILREKVPKNHLRKFIKFANLNIDIGQKLLAHAEQSNDHDLLLALLEANEKFFPHEKSEYKDSLLAGIELLKNYQLDQDNFLRKFLVNHPAYFTLLLTNVFSFYEAGLFPDDKISNVLLAYPDYAVELLQVLTELHQHSLFNKDFLDAVLSHPDKSIDIYNAIIRWHLYEREDNDFFRRLILTNESLIQNEFINLINLEEKNLLERWLEEDIQITLQSYPEEANNLTILIMGLKEVDKLDTLSKFLIEPNIKLAIEIGQMLIQLQLLDKIKEIDKFHLLDSDQIHLLSRTLIEIIDEPQDIAKEKFDVFVQSFSKKNPFKP